MIVAQNVHATGLVLGRTGVMLRGPSGSGKSLLALELIEQWGARGLEAKLVSDDRLDLVVENGALTMHAPKAIAGLIELRGRGIVERPHANKARVHLVVDLVADLIRLVEEDELTTEIMGIAVVRCPVPQAGVVDMSHRVLLIREALRSIGDSRSRSRQKTT
jgi:serine kinase of HPr protein (carbohydrate metabolism regulator)